MSWRFIVALIFAVIVSIFAIQNGRVIDVDFLMFQWSISKALVILVSAVIGAIVATLLGAVGWLKQQSKIKTTAKQVGRLTDESKDLLDQLAAKDDRIQALELQLQELKKVEVEHKEV